jgi:YggT family protein
MFMDEEVREVRRTTVNETPNTHEEIESYQTGVHRPLATQVLYYIGGVLLSLLAIRFVLSLLGANRGNGFADFIYGITYPFVAPFFGLFGYDVSYGVARFEFETLVAMAIYALLIYAIAKLINMVHRNSDHAATV